MGECEAELFNDSYERCLRQPGFLERFYEIFMASSEEVAAKFARTDFTRQRRLLKWSLYMLMCAASTPLPEVTTHLERISEVHSRGHMDIKPEFYDLWLDSLLQAVREFDPMLNEDIEAAWRQVLDYGIQFMKSKY